jgi:hypothetical protein
MFSCFFVAGIALASSLALAEGPKAVLPQNVVTPELQSKIVQLFSAERCDAVRKMVNQEFYDQLRPNVRAIVAYCEPEGVDPEDLFASAERQDPGADLVMLLHAKWVWLRDPERSYPLWDHVLEFSRNESFRSMAKRYLADEVEIDEPLHLTPLTWEAKAKAGGGYETNPLLPLAPLNPQPAPQAFSSAALVGGARRWYPFGSVSALYDGSYRRYLATPNISYFDNTVGVPVNFRVGPYADVSIRPFYGLSLAGPHQFGQRVGIAVMGVAYRPDYRQSVEGSVFQERLFFPAFTPQEGTHYRFDYDWEFFPGQWNYRLKALMEHVQAVNDYSNGTKIKYSHTDVGSSFRTQCLLHGVTFEGELSAKVRLDDVNSSWVSVDTGQTVLKRRNDFTVAVRPAISFQLNKELAASLSYELDRTWSPIGRAIDDYANFNIIDQRGELQLVTEFSNY